MIRRIVRKAKRYLPAGLSERLYYFMNRHFTDDSEEVRIQGLTFKLDKGDALHLSVWGEWEPFETKLLLETIQPGSRVVDVGAHIGYYTLLLSKQVGPAGHVYAFEPNRENFTVLEKNVLNNKLTNVTLINKAVSERNSMERLFISPRSALHHLSAISENLPSKNVKVTSLDNQFNDHPKAIDFIKLDIQGGEYKAVLGMKDIIDKNPGMMIMFEYSPEENRAVGTDSDALLNTVLDYGFDLYSILWREQVLKRFTRGDFAAMDNRKSLINILAVKPGSQFSENLKKFIS